MLKLTSDEIVLYDRTRSTTDWECPRKRYWDFEWEKTGLSPDSTQMELYLGTVVHDGLAMIARMWQASGVSDIDLIATTAFKQVYLALTSGQPDIESMVNYANEQAALVEGLLRGFYKHVWPRLMAKYTIVAVEQEMFYHHDEAGAPDLKGRFIFMSRPDLILEDKRDGSYIYYEYKTTSTKKEEWISSWDTAVQVHSTIEAVAETLGRRPVAAIVQGLYKGYVSYGKQSSPFCYAYRRNANPPFISEDIVYEYKNGYRRTPVWEMEGGLKTWVNAMPEAILVDLFPQTPPIFPNDDLIKDFFAQRASREIEIKTAHEMIDAGMDKRQVLNVCFPQRFDKCKGAYGADSVCRDRLLCHGCVSDPLKAGYTRRVPHHELEITTQASQKDGQLK